MAKDTQLNIIVDAKNNATAGLKGVSRDLGSLDQKSSSLAGSFSVLKAAAVAVTAAVGYAGLNVIKAGAQFEQTKIAFETMLGSAAVAKKTLADLSKFASETPFELAQLEEASKRLLAYGTTADDLLPTLKMLGDISAGVGMDKLPQLILAFGQVQAATKLTGAELRQFSEAGVPLLGVLADKFGTTEGAIIEMVQNGQISFEDMKLALATLTEEGGKFNNLMIKQSTSLGGMWSNLNDQIALTARVLGEQLLPIVKPILEDMIALATNIRSIAQNFGSLGTQMGALSPVLAAFHGYWLMIIEAFNKNLRPELEYLRQIFLANREEIMLVLKVLGQLIAFIAGTAVLGAIHVLAFAIHQVAEAFNVVINVMATMITWTDKVIKKLERLISLAGELGIVKKIGSFFGGGKAEGGPVSAGTSYMVGEQGPEMFTPTTNGTIIPNKKLSSTSSTTLVFSNNTFLSEDAAERMGDMILSRLKLSSAM